VTWTISDTALRPLPTTSAISATSIVATSAAVNGSIPNARCGRHAA